MVEDGKGGFLGVIGAVSQVPARAACKAVLGVLLLRGRRERLCGVKSRYQRYQPGWKTRSGVTASS